MDHRKLLSIRKSHGGQGSSKGGRGEQNWPLMPQRPHQHAPRLPQNTPRQLEFLAIAARVASVAAKATNSAAEVIETAWAAANEDEETEEEEGRRRREALPLLPEAAAKQGKTLMAEDTNHQENPKRSWRERHTSMSSVEGDIQVLARCNPAETILWCPYNEYHTSQNKDPPQRTIPFDGHRPQTSSIHKRCR